MAKLPLRETFDRNRDFVVRINTTVNGVNAVPGDPFDKYKVTTRRLRQLFDQRRLAMVPVRLEDGPGRPDFASLPDEAITSWLKAQDIVPRFGFSHEQLVQRATAEWTRQEAENLSAESAKPDLPPDWLQLKWFALRKKVQEVTGVVPNDKAHALKLMQTHAG